MFLLKKVISLIVSICFLCYSSLSLANTSTSTIGNFTILEKGNISPFDGILFDITGIATILVDDEQKDNLFQLKLDYLLEKQELKYKLDIDNLVISNEILKNTSTEIIKIKDKELEQLREKSLNSLGNFVYLGIGILSGILLTLVITITYERLTL